MLHSCPWMVLTKRISIPDKVLINLMLMKLYIVMNRINEHHINKQHLICTKNKLTLIIYCVFRCWVNIFRFKNVAIIIFNVFFSCVYEIYERNNNKIMSFVFKAYKPAFNYLCACYFAIFNLPVGHSLCDIIINYLIFIV